MQVQWLRPQDEKEWNKYVSISGNASLYHHAGWKKVIEKSFGHKTYYLLSENSNKKVNGILPLVHLKSLLFGNFMVSVPYFNYGGICADSADVYRALLEEAVRIAKSENVEHIELREHRQHNNGLPFKTSKVCMLLELPANPDDLWKSFPSKLRSQIRRPEKENMYAQIGKQEELYKFYQVFLMNMRDLGTPVYSIKFFKNMLDTFPESASICTIYKESEPVAAGFLLGFKDRLEIPWASSIRKYNSSSPNMLLYWSALQHACLNGYRFFDFGRSTPGEGTYKFKEQWGAKPVPLYWYYWMKDGNVQLPDLNPKNPKYNTAIAVWKKLPVGLTRVLGPAISKNLP